VGLIPDLVCRGCLQHTKTMEGAEVVQAPPPPKRIRRSTSALIREQQLRSLAPRLLDASSSAAAASQGLPGDAIVSAEEQVIVQFAEPIAEQVDTRETAAGSAKCFEGATLNHKRQLGRAPTFEVQDSKVSESERILISSEDIGNDLSVKTVLRLSTQHASFRWLRRLPPALRCQMNKVLDGPNGAVVKEAILEMCRECLPKLMEVPDKAVRWVERIAACLSWYQLDGPPMPSTPLAQSLNATPEERAAWRRVEEWDEAYRSLETLLRQGVVPTFTILADIFSIAVFGDGSGPWKSSTRGSVQQPTRNSPCAVLFPSLDDFRTMLQENHVPFEVAMIRKTVDGGAQNIGQDLRGGQRSDDAAARKEEALVPAGSAPPPSGAVPEMEEVRNDLRELRRDGQKVVTPEEMNGVVPMSSALWFEGSWRVHALLDVLRQHFLAAPLTASPLAAPRLPRLVAPAPFSHAAVSSAEVLRTQTLPGSGQQPQYTAELGGFFFPGQVRRLLEFLRVLLPSFSCGLTAEARHRLGINAFTPLGTRHIESVECERTQAGADSAAGWKWDFKLGT